MNPLISVLLPTYNCDKYINECIDSILCQTYANFELLIIDDCSTDNTVNLIKEYQDQRIKLVVKEKNSGYTDSLNWGIENAKGKYIARMDGDDVCMPTRFEEQVAFLEVNLNVILCGTAIQIIGTSTVLRHPSNHDAIKVKLCFSSSFYHPSVMGRIEVFRANLYNKKYEPAEDYDLWTRLAFQGKLANLEKILLLYRVHDNQVSNERKTTQDNNSLLCKLNMFSDFELENYFESTLIHLLISRRVPKTIQECKAIQSITQYLINKNKQLNIFNHQEFEKKSQAAKISQIKNFFTKGKFLKWNSYSFFIKFCSFSDFIKIINLKKRIKFK